MSNVKVEKLKDVVSKLPDGWVIKQVWLNDDSAEFTLAMDYESAAEPAPRELTRKEKMYDILKRMRSAGEDWNHAFTSKDVDDFWPKNIVNFDDTLSKAAEMAQEEADDVPRRHSRHCDCGEECTCDHSSSGIGTSADEQQPMTTGHDDRLG